MPESTTLKLCCWNARGYLTAIPYIRQILSDCDVLAISEHWLHENRLGILDEISLSHNVYARASSASCAEKYGSHRGQGGVAIFWHKRIAGISAVTDLIHDRACAIRMQTSDGSVIYFMSVYMPAQGSNDDLRVILDELSACIESREENALWCIMGDFNGDVGSAIGDRGTYAPTPQGSVVVDFFRKHNLMPCNMTQSATGPLQTFESHNACSTLDYIAIPTLMLDMMKQCAVLEGQALNNSDHLALHLTLEVDHVNLAPIQSASSPRLRWDKMSKQGIDNRYRKRLELHILQILELTDWDEITPQVIDQVLSDLTEAIARVSRDLPHSKFKRNLKPFWNQELSMLKF